MSCIGCSAASGRTIARYLKRPEEGYEPFTPSDPESLRAALKPGDVLLVEGNNHISGVIKYLTQSTWSHAALYVGPIGERTAADGEPLVLVEANLGQGVVGAPLSKYRQYHTRICRPIGLTDDDCARVCTYAAERIGFDYDVKNIFDLLRYLFPLPVPQRWRRRMMALGSGHPTRIICSALIAQAFEHVRYPILPKVTRLESAAARARHPRNPPLVALCAARFRHLALFRSWSSRPSSKASTTAAWPGRICRRPLEHAGLGRRSSAPRCGAGTAHVVPQLSHRRSALAAVAHARHTSARSRRSPCSTPPSRRWPRCSRRRSGGCC